MKELNNSFGQKIKSKKFWLSFFLQSLVIFALLLAVHWYQTKNLTKAMPPSIQYFLISGDTLDIDNYSKKGPLVVYFWASWCPACKFTSSVISDLAREYPVLTIAMSSGTDITVEEYLQENQLSFPVVNDEEGMVSQQWGVMATPTVFIINGNSEIVYKAVGIANRWLLRFRLWLLDFQ